MNSQQKLCIECQECCKWTTFLCPLNMALVEYYSTRGCKIVTHPERQEMAIMVPQQCRHLTEQGCTIYDKRPTLCKTYSGLDDPYLKDKCKWK